LEVKVKWQFTVEHAREKLNRHYENVIAKNLDYKALAT